MPSHYQHRSPVRHKRVIGLLVTAATASAAIVVANLAGGGASASTSNLVPDPQFSKGTIGWFTNPGGALAITAGHDGNPAIALRNASSSAKTFALNDKINTVASTRTGAVYQADAWIRTDSAQVSVAVRMMEWGTQQVGQSIRSAWLSNTNWVHVTTTYTAVSNGASIDFNVLAWQLPAGASIQVSEPSLVQLSGPASEPSATAPASSTASKPPISASPTSTSGQTTSQTASSGASSTVTTPRPPGTTTSSSPSTPQSSSTTAAPPATSTQSSTPSPTSSAPAGYKLVWSDDFNSLDPSKWNIRNNTWSNNEESVDLARNVTVANGALTIQASKEAVAAGSSTRNYSSGYIDTIGKDSWQYGRIEIRAKLPTAQGLWPAFWLRENSGLGELDVMEAIGGMDTKTVQTIHQSTDGGLGRAGHEDTFPSGDFSSWHTYAVDREPGSVTWYVDGRVVFTQTSSTLSWLESTFNQPMNIRLNLQVGGSMPAYYNKPVGAIPAGTGNYVIDYVRVYQR